MTKARPKEPYGLRLHKPREPERTYIEMRDEARLYLEVFRPDAPGSFPAILTRNPYHSVDIPPQTRDKSCHKELVTRGYAVVEAEVRGTGISEGTFRFLHNDGPDGYDTILWIREQPWCDGNIGMTGLSYLSMDQFAVAALKPPGLRAMFAGVGGADIYRDMVYPGGIPSSLAFNWAQRHVGRLISPYVPKLRNVSEPIDPEIYEMQVKVHGERLMQAYRNLLRDGYPFEMGYLKEWIEHPNDGPYWRGHSPYNVFSEIETPIYLFGGWFDLFPGPVIRAYLEIDAPKRLLMGPWFHGQNTGIDRDALRVRWFDYWLKGIDNGVMDEPPIMYYVMGREEWRVAKNWPPEAEAVRYYLARGEETPTESINDGLLSLEPPEAGEEPDAIIHDPENPVPSVAYRYADIREGERRSLTYTTGVLGKDLEVLGSIRVAILMSTNASDVDWTAKLTEVLPTGESILYTSSALRGSHHRSHEEPEELVPGQVYPIEFNLHPTCKVFGKGSRMRLVVANSDFPLLLPNPTPSESSLYHGKEASHITLPVALK